MVLMALVALVVVTLAVAWYASRGSSDGGGAGGDRIEHVHGLGINPADGTLYAAAHNGVFRFGGGGKASRVGKGAQDTMGFTVVGPDHFLASGHPGQDAGGAPHLGLIESTDGGVTWSTLSLEGEADFHALRYRHGAVYGYNSTSGQLMVSEDKRSWGDRSKVAVRDFVVSPKDPDTLAAAGGEGLMRSSDGGRTWSRGEAAVMLLDWPSQDRLWALTADRSVTRSTDGGKTWSSSGQFSGDPAAFAADGGTLYLATVAGEILRSTDGGKNWNTLYS